MEVSQLKLNQTSDAGKAITQVLDTKIINCPAYEAREQSGR